MCQVQVEFTGIIKTVTLQVDTGAAVSALGPGIARRLFKGSHLNRTSARLFGFGQHRLQVLGTLPALVSYRGREANAEFFIIDSEGDDAVMGLDLLRQLNVNLHPASGAIDQLTVAECAEAPTSRPSQPDPGELCSLTTVHGTGSFSVLVRCQCVASSADSRTLFVTKLAANWIVFKRKSSSNRWKSATGFIQWSSAERKMGNCASASICET